MNDNKARVTWVLLLAVAVCGSSPVTAQLLREAGDRLQRKIDAIAQNGASNPTHAMRTTVTESEVDSYLAFNAKDKIPKGLSNPGVHILDNGQLTGRVLVDIDEFNRSRQSNGLMDPLSYISGQVPVTARGTLRASGGKGQFQLASAELMGFPLPKPVLQELVSFFTRTRENPAGFNLDAPFNLPAKIREVAINRGEAVIVQ
ncbi:MAG TPA: hypothetical protein VGA09_21770 [Candidatus Binatia bacterium]